MSPAQKLHCRQNQKENGENKPKAPVRANLYILFMARGFKCQLFNIQGNLTSAL